MFIPTEMKKFKNSILRIEKKYIEELVEKHKFSSDLKTIMRICKRDEIYSYARENHKEMQRKGISKKQFDVCRYRVVLSCYALNELQKTREL